MWLRLSAPCLALACLLPLAGQTRVVVLGSGSPVADPDRSGPAFAVVVNGQAYLVDAGPGIVRRAAAAARAGITELQVPKLDRVFITHLHSDHTLGLPDLMLSPWVLGRKTPLEAWGPPGLAAMTTDILNAWSKDIAVRTEGLEHANPTGYHVKANEIYPGLAYRDANVTVTAFAVHHGTWDYAYGYRFETADKTIVFSGDTSPVQSIVDACNGCDLLFHEVYNRDGVQQREPDQLPYFAQFHTSGRELAHIATEAHPKLLVLVHQIFEGLPESALIAQVEAGYKGPIVSAHDLQVF